MMAAFLSQWPYVILQAELERESLGNNIDHQRLVISHVGVMRVFLHKRLHFGCIDTLNF